MQPSILYILQSCVQGQKLKYPDSSFFLCIFQNFLCIFIVLEGDKDCHFSNWIFGNCYWYTIQWHLPFKKSNFYFLCFWQTLVDCYQHMDHPAHFLHNVWSSVIILSGTNLVFIYSFKSIKIPLINETTIIL